MEAAVHAQADVGLDPGSEALRGGPSTVVRLHGRGGLCRGEDPRRSTEVVAIRGIRALEDAKGGDGEVGSVVETDLREVC